MINMLWIEHLSYGRVLATDRSALIESRDYGDENSYVEYVHNFN